MTVALAMVVAILLVWVFVLLAFARPLLARWREPVLKHPVMAIESDDWGAGPLVQAGLLRRLAALLQRIRDRDGRPALMTLGVVLEVPEGPRIAATDAETYHALPLSDARFDDLRTSMAEGVAARVFALQLHGQCHYWPPTLMAAARHDAGVRAWLAAPEPAATEELPSPLQSRWVDASTLPSRPHDPLAVEQAVARESAEYAALFGAPPEVAVATTFVWTDAVEAAWARQGVRVIVTPGRRATCRTAEGAPGCIDRHMLTGERSLAGPTYLVRDVYFEPVMGHAPQRLVDGLRTRTRQGRACLVETHRSNFLESPERSLAVLADGLAAALAVCPDLRFLSPRELVDAIRAHDPAWIETRLGPRLAAWCARLDEIPRFRRLARLSGLVLPLAVLRHLA